MEALTRLFEWKAIENKALAWPYSQPEFISDFQEYLNTVWESRNWYKEDESKKINEGRSAAKQRFFTFYHNKIKARNYVGVVQFEGHRIEIYPKIFQDCKEPDFKSYFQHLLYWLSYCRRINFPVSKTALDDLPTDDFLEALIYIFAHYTATIRTQNGAGSCWG
ncbi:5-methylcytosine restriction system specificity protein McrC [Adhaeribacter rhizoryzae]|uniref:Uncharacterized protein n=1 Tax=Adhaeribacter rhizoryzae TaxID=2607907 RepID=A0A5M6DKL6_9BACT|nr:hypothetical protein [Adhaeribacter rhizoryzae]KAA5548087.1 hypothetical protein F0145_05005 [Adhaeribacter rhizoryzae]